MATHSSILAWRIPGRREPGGLPSMGSQRVGHNWSDLAAEGEEKEKRAQNLFEETIAESFPNLGKETGIQVQETQRIPNKMKPRKSTPNTAKLKWQNLKIKGKSNAAKKATAYVKYICIQVHICALNTYTHVYTGYVKYVHRHTHTQTFHKYIN